MRKNLLLLLLLAGIQTLCAKERTTQQILQAAHTALSHTGNSQMRKANAHMQMDVIQRSAQLTVVGGENGFAIIANDDLFEAVLGYSDKEYDASNLAPGFSWWLEAMNQQLQENLNKGVTTVAVLPESPKFASSVDQLLQTEWGQNAPYNYMTPTYTTGTGANKQEVHYVTGCVATAMSQIMYFHKWPEKGKGNVSYYFTPEGTDQSQKLSDNLAKMPYEWDKMLTIYKGVSYTEAQGNAVALLMKHCGYAVNMQYTRSGSGAYTSDAADAMRKRFYYNENMHFYRRDFFPVKEWMEKIFTELDSRHPVLYGAQSSSGGHEFVLDGYDEDGKVHVNWGWDGGQNGFFDIATLNGYNSGQEMVLVRKNDELIPYQSYWGMNSNLQISNPTITALKASFSAYNLDYNKFTGQVGIIALNLSTNQKTILASDNVSDVEYLHGANFSYSSVDLTSLENGTYRIYAATLSSTESNWQPIRCDEKGNNSYLLTVNNGAYKLEAENDANWTDIRTIFTNSASIRNGIFNIKGQYLGTDMNTLPKGVYIVGGKKIVK